MANTNCEISVDDKVQIIELRAQGKSFADIARKIGRSKTGVRLVIKRWHELAEIENKSRPGRPPKISEDQKSEILHYIAERPEDTFQEITNASGLNICPRTVGRIARDAGYYVYSARVEEALNNKHKDDRVSWCQERIEWGLKQWRLCVFMDETKVNSSGQDGPKKRVRRKRGTRNEQQYVDYQHHSGRYSLQFWAAITYGFHTPLVFIRQRPPNERKGKNDRGGMTAVQYCQEVLPYLTEFFNSLPEDGKNHQIIEDLSKPHQAAVTSTFYKDHGINKSPWVAKSPDLNAIENVWSMLKTRIKKRVRKLFPESSSSAAVWPRQPELIKIAKEEWELIDWSKVDSMIDGMPRRLAAVINGDGERTKY